MRILIADDHVLVRAGIRALVMTLPEVDEVGEVGNERQLLEQVRSRPWDLLILGLSMPPDRSGVELVRRIKDIQPGLAVLVLTVHAEGDYALQLFKMGAAGFLNKEAAPELLVSATRAVMHGGRFVSPGLEELLVRDNEIGAGRPLHEALSTRELQVLQHLAHGETLSLIAAHLALSVRTVSTYRSRILGKLNLTTTAELIHYARVHHLVE